MSTRNWHLFKLPYCSSYVSPLKRRKRFKITWNYSLISDHTLRVSFITTSRFVHWSLMRKYPPALAMRYFWLQDTLPLKNNYFPSSRAIARVVMNFFSVLLAVTSKILLTFFNSTKKEFLIFAQRACKFSFKGINSSRAHIHMWPIHLVGKWKLSAE